MAARLRSDLPPPPSSAGSSAPRRPPVASTAPLYVLRPFPPPYMKDIPMDYIIDRLHHLAPQYWNNMETTDCTLIVPLQDPKAVFSPDASSGSLTAFFFPSTSTTSNANGTGLGRRATEPSVTHVTKVSMKLHTDYLSAQSSFLRNLFSGALSIDLVPSVAPSSGWFESHDFQSPHSPVDERPSVAPPMPRFLPSTPGHPAVFLPLPDPYSFPFLVHWMYWGTIDWIAKALATKVITWDGLWQNSVYLGLGSEILTFLRRWHLKWGAIGYARCESVSASADLDLSDKESSVLEDEDGDGMRSLKSCRDESPILSDDDSGFEEFSRARTITQHPAMALPEQTFESLSSALLDLNDIPNTGIGMWIRSPPPHSS